MGKRRRTAAINTRVRADLRHGLPSQKVARSFRVQWSDKGKAGGRQGNSAACRQPPRPGTRWQRWPDPAAASGNKATRCRGESADVPGVPGQRSPGAAGHGPSSVGSPKPPPAQPPVRCRRGRGRLGTAPAAAPGVRGLLQALTNPLGRNWKQKGAPLPSSYSQKWEK